MPVFEIADDSLVLLEPTTFTDLGLTEREDIQKLVKGNLDVLGEPLLLLSEEYGNWDDSRRRLDLLCLDQDGNLIVVELKRDESVHMELQAIRYGAMVSSISFDECVAARAKYFASTEEAAKTDILDFLDTNENELEFSPTVKIILVSTNFSKELTTAVLWLNEHDVEIRCILFTPVVVTDGRTLLDAKQIIPLPDVADFQTKIRARAQAAREADNARHQIRFDFWSQLLREARGRTNLHQRISPSKNPFITFGSGRTGLRFGYAARKYDSQVELYIDFGDAAKNRSALDFLAIQKTQIEEGFGAPLEWQVLDSSRGCRVRFCVKGGYRTDPTQWQELHTELISRMISLEKALRPWISQMP